MGVQIILLSGKQGSGKTTLQKELTRFLHFRKSTRVHGVNFADPLYKMHNFCLSVLEGLGIKRDIVKDGPLLQLLGTEWGRKTVDENIWVKALNGRIDFIMQREGTGFEHNIIIIGDCRFKNELAGLPEALRVRLECPKSVRKERCEAWRENETHPSEVDLDDAVVYGHFDMVFNTQTQSTKEIAQLIAAQLDKNVWLEKRINTKCPL